jgi:hypothetical protein
MRAKIVPRGPAGLLAIPVLASVVLVLLGTEALALAMEVSVLEATPVWLLGSFAVLSLLYRGEVSAGPAAVAAEPSAEQAPTSAAVAPRSTRAAQAGAEVLTKRAQAERAYAELSATGAPVSAGQLASAAGLSASYARALVAEFQAQPSAANQHNGRRPALADTDPDLGL